MLPLNSLSILLKRVLNGYIVQMRISLIFYGFLTDNTKYPRGIEEHTCYCSLRRLMWSNCSLALKLSRFRTCSFLLRIIFSIMFLKLDSSRSLRCSPMKKHSDRKISGILRNSGCILLACFLYL